MTHFGTFYETINDDLAKSRKTPFPVIPAKAGIQLLPLVIKPLDSGFHRSDDFLRDHQYSIIPLFQYSVIPVLPSERARRGPGSPDIGDPAGSHSSESGSGGPLVSYSGTLSLVYPDSPPAYPGIREGVAIEPNPVIPGPPGS